MVPDIVEIIMCLQLVGEGVMIKAKRVLVEVVPRFRSELFPKGKDVCRGMTTTLKKIYSEQVESACFMPQRQFIGFFQWERDGWRYALHEIHCR